MYVLYAFYSVVYCVVLVFANRIASVDIRNPIVWGRVLRLWTQGLIGVAAANLATKKAAGSANGMKGMFGYLSTLISGLGFGYIAQHFGWNAIYMFMIATSVIGMGIFIYMWNAPANGYDEQ